MRGRSQSDRESNNFYLHAAKRLPLITCLRQELPHQGEALQRTFTAVALGAFRLFYNGGSKPPPYGEKWLFAPTKAFSSGRRWRKATDEVSASLFALSYGFAQTNDYPQNL